MGRVIKFRCWDKATNRMFTGFHLFGEATCFDLVSQWLMEQPLGKPSLERMNDAEVMQFSGLTDKNGNDIYDGDIIHLTSSFHTDRGNHLVELGEYNGDRGPEYGYWWFNYLKPEDGKGENLVEVIGNIHQHPSLLSGGDQRGGTTDAASAQGEEK